MFAHSLQSLITFLSHPFSLLHSSSSLSLVSLQHFLLFLGSHWLTHWPDLTVFLLFLTSLCGFLVFGEWKINTSQFEIPTSQISLSGSLKSVFWLVLALLRVQIGFRVGFLNWFPEVLGVGFRRILWQGRRCGGRCTPNDLRWMRTFGRSDPSCEVALEPRGFNASHRRRTREQEERSSGV
jgi:hypothetical protein